MSDRRKICFVITSRVHYSRSRLLLAALRGRDDIDLRIVVGGSALLPRYGEVVSALESDGYRVDVRLHTVVEGGTHGAMAKTAGLALLEFTSAFESLEPNIVVIRGDRFEMLPAAAAAAYLNMTVAHIEGGDVSGSIDESVRHSITKLAHLHFVTNDDSRRRLLRMGERPDRVHLTGSLDVEYASRAAAIDWTTLQGTIDSLGTGARVDLALPYLVVVQHPVTTEEAKDGAALDSRQYQHVTETLEAVRRSGMQALWFWPNIDAGTDAVAKAIRMYREWHSDLPFRFLINVDPDTFLSLLRGARCLVGNSSAGIKECTYFGLPVVDIGTRQAGRHKSGNIREVGYDAVAILAAIRAQVDHGVYPSDRYYFREGTSDRIAAVLATAPLETQKRFYDGHD